MMLPTPPGLLRDLEVTLMGNDEPQMTNDE
jgi:hypothetical protein